MRKTILLAVVMTMAANLMAQNKPVDFRSDRGVLVMKPYKHGINQPISQVRTRLVITLEQLGYTVDQMNTARRPWRYTVMEKNKNGWLVQIVVQERRNKVMVSGFCFADKFQYKYRSWQGGQIEEITQRDIVFAAHNALRHKLPELYLIDPKIFENK